MSEEYSEMATSTWLIRVGDYAEFEQGLDPIGASDILHDLNRFAMMWLLDGYEKIDPALIWENFVESDMYKRYWR